MEFDQIKCEMLEGGENAVVERDASSSYNLSIELFRALDAIKKEHLEEMMDVTELKTEEENTAETQDLRMLRPSNPLDDVVKIEDTEDDKASLPLRPSSPLDDVVKIEDTEDDKTSLPLRPSSPVDDVIKIEDTEDDKASLPLRPSSPVDDVIKIEDTEDDKASLPLRPSSPLDDVVKSEDPEDDKASLPMPHFPSDGSVPGLGSNDRTYAQIAEGIERAGQDSSQSGLAPSPSPLPGTDGDGDRISQGCVPLQGSYDAGTERAPSPVMLVVNQNGGENIDSIHKALDKLWQEARSLSTLPGKGQSNKAAVPQSTEQRQMEKRKLLGGARTSQPRQSKRVKIFSLSQLLSIRHNLLASKQGNACNTEKNSQSSATSKSSYHLIPVIKLFKAKPPATAPGKDQNKAQHSFPPENSRHLHVSKEPEVTEKIGEGTSSTSATTVQSKKQLTRDKEVSAFTKTVVVGSLKTAPTPDNVVSTKSLPVSSLKTAPTSDQVANNKSLSVGSLKTAPTSDQVANNKNLPVSSLKNAPVPYKVVSTKSLSVGSLKTALTPDNVVSTKSLSVSSLKTPPTPDKVVSPTASERPTKTRCRYCNKRFSAQNILRHEKCVFRDTKLRCYLCWKVFKAECAYKAHMLEHYNSRKEEASMVDRLQAKRRYNYDEDAGITARLFKTRNLASSARAVTFHPASLSKIKNTVTMNAEPAEENVTTARLGDPDGTVYVKEPAKENHTTARLRDPHGTVYIKEPAKENHTTARLRDPDGTVYIKEPAKENHATARLRDPDGTVYIKEPAKENHATAHVRWPEGPDINEPAATPEKEQNNAQHASLSLDRLHPPASKALEVIEDNVEGVSTSTSVQWKKDLRGKVKVSALVGFPNSHSSAQKCESPTKSAGSLAGSDSLSEEDLELLFTGGFYRCPLCTVLFRWKWLLQKHLATHPQCNLCQVCLEEFPSVGDLVRHMALHYRHELLCEVCGKQFDMVYGLASHLSKHRVANAADGGSVKSTASSTVQAVLELKRQMGDVTDEKCGEVAPKHKRSLRESCEPTSIMKKVSFSIGVEGKTAGPNRIDELLQLHYRQHTTNTSNKILSVGSLKSAPVPYKIVSTKSLSVGSLKTAPVPYKVVSPLASEKPKKTRCRYCNRSLSAQTISRHEKRVFRDTRLRCYLCWKVFQALCAYKAHMLEHYNSRKEEAAMVDRLQAKRRYNSDDDGDIMSDSEKEQNNAQLASSSLDRLHPPASKAPKIIEDNVEGASTSTTVQWKKDLHGKVKVSAFTKSALVGFPNSQSSDQKCELPTKSAGSLGGSDSLSEEDLELLFTGGFYRCPLCTVLFRWKWLLQKHLATHPQCNLCQVCLEEFPSVGDLVRHMALHHRHELLCEVCGKQFDMVYGLASHLSKHRVANAADAGGDRSTASSTVQTVQDLKRQMGDFTDEECGEVAPKHKRSLRESCEPTSIVKEVSFCNSYEGKKARPNRIFQLCYEVKQSVESNTALAPNNHEPTSIVTTKVSFGNSYKGKTARPNRIVWLCYEGKKFPDLDKDVVHKSRGKHQCVYCDQRFRSMDLLHLHYRQHTANTKFSQCWLCQNFVPEEDFGHHCSSLHGDKTPLRCERCGVWFPSWDGLKAHLSEHPVYGCDTCGRTFTHFGLLDVHVQRHVLPAQAQSNVVMVKYC